MVSLKKVGAIATGALFVGATVGMASAVTVPADFKASMLADKGVAKAQLVVGKDAPGKVEDTASAEIIQEAVKTKLAYAGVGGDIKIEWASKDLDGDGTDDTDDATIDTDGGEASPQPISVGLWFDSDGDGAPESDDDYLLYNYMRYERVGTTVDITPYLKAVAMKKFDYVQDVNGNTLKIRDNKYFVTKIDTEEDKIKMGIPSTRTLPATTDLEEAKKWTVEDRDIWVYSVAADGSSVTLYISGKGQHTVSTSNGTYSQTSWMKDNFDGVLVVKPDPAVNAAELLYVSPDSIVTVEDDAADVLGYSVVKLGGANVTDGDITGSTNITMEFRGPAQTLEKDETQTLEDTLYTVEWDWDDKDIKIRTSQEATVSSGTKLRTNRKPGKHFLNENIILTVTGGEELAPELEIVDEDTADKNMNLVLIGGPVANKLTADLVNAGKSTVDWYTSDGDIEVIADAFGTGSYGIIVAGKTRTETRAAAEALANAL